ncbi:MAG: response regulator [Magnetococcales bacterium]|nr:response regulator [Magnetococcales bacterium]
MKILIADDELNNRMLLHQYLATWGTCDLVHHGAEAVEAFEMAASEGKPYDLICMDRFMPNMQGEDALILIRELEVQWGLAPLQRAMVLLISGEETPLSPDCTQDGFTDRLLKPITQEQLYDCLRQHGFLPPEPIAWKPTTESVPFQELPGLNVADGLDRSVGNPRLYRSLLLQFLSDHSQDVQQMLTALEAGFHDEAHRLLHGLKGASGNIGAERLHLAAKACDEELRQLPSQKIRLERQPELDQAMEELLTGLRTLLTP